VYALRDDDPVESSQLYSSPVLTTGPIPINNGANTDPKVYLSDLSPCMDGHLRQLVASILVVALTMSVFAIVSRSRIKQRLG
jgi:hypothetical protein